MFKIRGFLTCPLCQAQVAVRSSGNLERHPSHNRRGVECLAGGRTYAVALRMMKNRRAGRHTKRNEDGSWLA